MSKITKNTIVADALKIAPKSAKLFMEIGMHCLGCPASSGESIEQACAAHGANVDELIEKINKLSDA